TASIACRPGTISPAANGDTWNLLSVASATYLEKVSAAPHSVSSDLGKLEVRRHFSSGIDCAIAGAAIAAEAASPVPAVLMNSRRFMMTPWSFGQFSIARARPAPTYTRELGRL